jgi:hypothetical protein
VGTGESGSMFSRFVSVYAKPKRFCSLPPNVDALTPAYATSSSVSLYSRVSVS